VQQAPSNSPVDASNFVALVEAFPEPVWILDSNLHPRFWNEALVRLSRKEHVSAAELAEMTSHAWFRHPEVHASLSRGLGAPSKTECEIDGKYFELSCSPFRTAESAAGVIAVFHEVTLLKRAEQARMDLVVNVSHELRTPLTAIKGFTDTLKDELEHGVTTGALDYLAVISRNADRLMALIQDLLLLSRLESGGDALALEKISTQEITEKSLHGLRQLQEKFGQQVVTHYGVKHFDADPLRVEQVLVNLVGNAIRYAPASSGPVEVRWSETADAVVLEVVDSGPGIAPDLQPRIFERFYRADSGRSRDLGGTGLGLAIVKHILLRHGGSVELESEEGRGSRFICRFPKRTPSAP